MATRPRWTAGWRALVALAVLLVVPPAVGAAPAIRNVTVNRADGMLTFSVIGSRSRARTDGVRIDLRPDEPSARHMLFQVVGRDGRRPVLRAWADGAWTRASSSGLRASRFAEVWTVRVPIADIEPLPPMRFRVSLLRGETVVTTVPGAQTWAFSRMASFRSYGGSQPGTSTPSLPAPPAPSVSAPAPQPEPRPQPALEPEPSAGDVVLGLLVIAVPLGLILGFVLLIATKGREPDAETPAVTPAVPTAAGAALGLAASRPGASGPARRETIPPWPERPGAPEVPLAAPGDPWPTR